MVPRAREFSLTRRLAGTPNCCPEHAKQTRLSQEAFPERRGPLVSLLEMEGLKADGDVDRPLLRA